MLVLRSFAVDRALGISAAPEIIRALARLFAPSVSAGMAPSRHLAVRQSGSGFELEAQGEKPLILDSFGGVIEAVRRALHTLGGFATQHLAGSLLSFSGKGVLVIAARRTDVLSLTGWALDRDFSLAGTEGLRLGARQGTITAEPGPIRLGADERDAVFGSDSFRGAKAVRFGTDDYLIPSPGWLAGGEALDLGAVVAVDATQGEVLLTALDEDHAAELLSLAVKAAGGTASGALLRALAANVPVIGARFRSADELTDRLDILVKSAVELEWTPAQARGVLAATRRAGSVRTPAAPAPTEPPAATDRELTTPLTIALATYDDFDGAYFTVQSTRLFHPEVLDKVSFLVLDNNPGGVCAPYLKALENAVPNYRYVPYTGRMGTIVRDRLFAETQSEYVMCVDSHIMIAPGALQRLFAYLDAHPRTRDLMQGPLLHDDMSTVSTHYEPTWKQGFYGTWGSDPRGQSVDAEPFDIGMCGLGLFVARREDWLGFNPRMSGFGGEEGYIHEKYRRDGRRTICLPFLRWVHRFPRPFGVPYRLTWEDRIWNYLHAHRELALPLDDMRQHFAEVLGEDAAATLFEQAEEKMRAI